MNHAIIVKLYHLYTQFPHNIRPPLESFRDTPMKAYDITKLIAELKSTEIKYMTVLFIFVS